MLTLGLSLRLLIGPIVPLPVLLPQVLEAIQSVEIRQTDDGPSMFQVLFRVSKTGMVPDYDLLAMHLFQPGFRMQIVAVVNNVLPVALMDGIITNIELIASSQPGASTLSVTGEDLTVVMDMTEKILGYPEMNEYMITNAILATYEEYGILPTVIPPPLEEVPLVTDHVPMQHGTDLEMLRYMAKKFGYYFFIIPQIAPLPTIAYWGPPKRESLPQPALIVNMGPFSNVETIHFRYNSLAPKVVDGFVQDSVTNVTMPVLVPGAERVPPLGLEPAIVTQEPFVRKRLPDSYAGLYGGINIAEAEAYGLGQVSLSIDTVVTGQGELDVLKYGRVLQPFGVVGVQGAGLDFDGFYYVKAVTHKLTKGSFRQEFTLAREGMMETTPNVVPDIG